ncbi:MAG: U32 family peptidase [Planctomycetes bacterium]|nr:U32 family peptidase [Planctomycetota bacterium]
MTKPELLAPAGTLEKLKWAVAYGADAVYFGTTFGSLRNFAGNLSLEEAAEGLTHLHEHDRKGYVTLNIYPFSEEYDQVRSTAGALDDMGVDALIVADLGVLTTLTQMGLKADIHISTQANTVSAQAASAYATLGATRVNLARELSLAHIEAIQTQVQGVIDTEVFVHGAVCFSYSGRCAISDYLTGFRANHGECKHPCRWKYTLMEEKRPGEYMPVFEDDRGLYLFHNKDLALYEFIPAMADAGIKSFKLEGRMKSVHYIASTVAFYRQVIDSKAFSREQAGTLLGRIPNRGYATGFMSGSITADDYSLERSGSQGTGRFVGNVVNRDNQGRSLVEVRNTMKPGDTLEVLTPDGHVSTLILPDSLIDKRGRVIDVANNSQFIRLAVSLPKYTVLRRVQETIEDTK